MTNEERRTIETNEKIRELIDSAEWAADNLGLLESSYYHYCQDLGVSFPAAYEWLHEED